MLNNYNEILKWDVKSWKKAILFWEKEVDWTTITDCLELGGNEGGLSLWLAKKGKRVVCSDIQEKKEIAKALHVKYGIQDLITYQIIDAVNIPYENKFDLIIFKSVLGGVGREDNKEAQKIAIAQIHKALKPGGILLFAENTTASKLHQVLRKNKVSWANSWRYVSLDDMKEFLTPYFKFTLHTNGFLATFGRTEKQRRILSYIDSVFFNPFLPSHYKYIVYGVAKKINK